jgi:signal transduction histidine kinase
MKSKGRRKFKNRVVTVFALISLLPLLVITISILILVWSTQQNNIVDLEKLAIANTEDKITKYFQEQLDALNIVVTADIKSLYEIPVDNLVFLLQSSYNISNPRSLEFIDSSGDSVLKLQTNDDIVYNSNYLNNQIKLGLATKDKKLISNLAGRTLDMNLVKRMSQVEGQRIGNPYFEAAVSGKQYIGNADFNDNNKVLRLSSQINNVNNEIIGVVSAETSLESINKIVKQVRLGEQGYIYVVDNNGRVIGSGNEEYLVQGANANNIEIVKKGLSKRVEIFDFYTYTNLEEKNVAYAYALMLEPEWLIVSEWPVGDAFSFIRGILTGTLVITLLTILVVVFMGIYFTGQITKPIRALDKGAREIAKGNLDWKVKPRTNDEFETLADKFNEMAEVLKENRKLRDEFVFISAHELRTPVTAIKGYLSMVLEGSFGPVAEKISEPLKIVRDANDRLVQLVHDLLEIARSEAGKMKISIKEVNVKENIDSVIAQLKPLADEKSIPINYRSMPAEIKIKADPDKLKEVLINIIGNSIKYTAGNGSIDISHEIKEKDVITHIKDHGIGMSQKEMESLFQKFYRVQNDDTDQIEGTGLGLFICKEIVERMNGEIWAVSAKGEGSTFSFRFEKA